MLPALRLALWSRTAAQLSCDCQRRQHGIDVRFDVFFRHRVLGLGAGVTQSIFEGGTLATRERAARATYVQADEQRKSTVLTAFQNVADTLNALQQDADSLKRASAAKDATAVTLDLTNKPFQTGYVGYLALLNAEQTYQQTVIALVQAQANRHRDTAGLFQALGGEWWNRADLLSK